ncbi:uncharacterized protein LY89DRAFT_783791 [Mollisia scopiformis]|uniref:Polynucleotide 5'-hydroxyl-kinase GRC3 n=1 Tax=Mollisia scopiformis TaxID=149040 RepID=A0A194X3C3_MOLSC|nr:uncharacterized protein LY89DRAFT_783791 [Mollisia scopiformis]KUJ14700.1 hypothetical protein LY89DRAFT_783791 [Mollisia scopiformis]
MSSSKRRKLEVPSKSPQLSAFAARKALQSTESSPRGQNGQSEDSQANDSNDNTPSIRNDTLVQAQSRDLDESVLLKSKQSEATTSNEEIEIETGQSSSSIESRAESREVPVERPVTTLSSFRPSKSSFKELEGGTLRIKLAPGERLVVLGQYELSVRKGQVTLMGCILQASKASYPVFALSSHSLPVIRCSATEIDDAEIVLCQYKSGLETLGALSPLFANLGNQNLTSLGAPFKDLPQNSTISSFQILFSSPDSSQRTYVQPIISAPEWNAVLAKSSIRPVDTKPPVIMICGPKSSGKSTFAKLLTNKLLLSRADAFETAIQEKQTGVALLDIDPGQPEYSPPGQLALLHIHEPNFGPPFVHPVPGTNSRIIHSHSIAALSPSMDTKHYMACAWNLISHYQNLQLTVPGCPLIINTPGWVLGTGLEILVELVTRAKPSSIIYMSLDGPPEVVSSLKDVAKLTPITIVPSQLSEYTTRTAAHLRTMQYLSYFHLNSPSSGILSWFGQPLTSIPPWEISYSSENAGILGVMCYGEQPPPELLVDTINGSLVAVVVIDDMAAIPGWSETRQDGTEDQHAEPNKQWSPLAEDSGMGELEEDSFRPRQIHRPLIVSTPKEAIPYFNPANPITINPQYSHSIGLALVRGIDVTRRRLQVLTPISPNVIQDINEAGKPIILVSGKLDTPGWAYTEELLLKTNRERADDDNDGMILDDDDEDEDEDEMKIEGTDTQKNTGYQSRPGYNFENVPWVEQLDGSGGRGIGSRVWRVRRDLGKQGDRAE